MNHLVGNVDHLVVVDTVAVVVEIVVVVVETVVVVVETVVFVVEMADLVVAVEIDLVEIVQVHIVLLGFVSGTVNTFGKQVLRYLDRVVVQEFGNTFDPQTI